MFVQLIPPLGLKRKPLNGLCSKPSCPALCRASSFIKQGQTKGEIAGTAMTEPVHDRRRICG